MTRAEKDILTTRVAFKQYEGATGRGWGRVMDKTLPVLVDMEEALEDNCRLLAKQVSEEYSSIINPHVLITHIENGCEDNFRGATVLYKFLIFLLAKQPTMVDLVNHTVLHAVAHSNKHRMFSLYKKCGEANPYDFLYRIGLRPLDCMVPTFLWAVSSHEARVWLLSKTDAPVRFIDLVCCLPDGYTHRFEPTKKHPRSRRPRGTAHRCPTPESLDSIYRLAETYGHRITPLNSYQAAVFEKIQERLWNVESTEWDRRCALTVWRSAHTNAVVA